eukprot:TRINITY_DN15048_c1_g1_i1.p1 TRINITY_DN15048_c1_g1~~TRINITY_DN15048_c1_g1_i1.p1  ORF type:complete len:238 (+),score=77.70 TRINITY_DN15048_c1_g1_i1:68-781(+)
MPAKPSKNSLLAKGLHRHGGGGIRMKRLKAKYQGVVKAAEAPKKVQKPYGKKGETRTIQPRIPGSFSLQNTPKRLKRSAQPIQKLRSSLTPGTVVILLNGKYPGARAVVLKQMAQSGQLLVTGPYSVNRVPLHRVEQSHVIATSTKLDLGNSKVDEKFNDAYFKTPVEKKTKSEKKDELFVEKKEEKKAQDPAKAADQKAADAAVVAAVEKQGAVFKKYLKSRFTLRNGQHPHLLKF